MAASSCSASLLGPGVWWGQGQLQHLVGAVSEREGDGGAFLRH